MHTETSESVPPCLLTVPAFGGSFLLWKFDLASGTHSDVRCLHSFNVLALPPHPGTLPGPSNLLSWILLYCVDAVKIPPCIDFWIASLSSVALLQIPLFYLEFLFSSVLKSWSSMLVEKYCFWVNVLAAILVVVSNAPLLFGLTWHCSSLPLQPQA